MTVTGGNQTLAATTADTPVPVRFNQPGVHDLLVSFDGPQGSVQTTLRVEALQVDLGPAPAIWLHEERAWSPAPSNSVIEAAPNLVLGGPLSNGRLSSVFREPAQLLARTEDAGPVLAASPADTFEVWSRSSTLMRIVET